MRIKLDRTVCDGFGLCGIHAPETFSLDEWGYASVVERGGQIAAGREDGVHRALRECPVHAITELPDAADGEGRGGHETSESHSLY